MRRGAPGNWGPDAPPRIDPGFPPCTITVFVSDPVLRPDRTRENVW